MTTPQSKAKYTKGPWLGPIDGEDSKSGYGVYTQQSECEFMHVGDFGRREDAILASAAPELAEASMELLIDLKAFISCAKRGEAAFGEQIAKLESALRKAGVI